MHRPQRQFHDGYDDHSRYEPLCPPYDPNDPNAPYSQGAYGEGTRAEPTQPYEPRWTRRRRTAVAAVLVASALVPVAVDRAVAARIESRTAKAFQEGMGTPLPPEVHVRGIPAVTQAASGTLRQVDITAHDIPARDTTRPLPVSELSLRLHGLTKSDDGSEARARSAEATAFLSYEDVSNALALEVSEGGRPGQVSAAVLLPLGTEVTVTTTVSAASGNRIAFTDFQVAGGVLPGAGNALLDKVFERPIQLRNIPDGLRLRSVTATADGLTARFSGRSVTFRPEGASGDA
ncbi:LmeA family phospholipid-binding protein [Streptomyces sp. SD31]|uniref:LmeA family phospholipid-binding protein n=1 Tax=Streptomyces sp. SD31 TaxID=3452208 RepID=UPI003F898679